MGALCGKQSDFQEDRLPYQRPSKPSSHAAGASTSARPTTSTARQRQPKGKSKTSGQRLGGTSPEVSATESVSARDAAAAAAEARAAAASSRGKPVSPTIGGNGGLGAVGGGGKLAKQLEEEKRKTDRQVLKEAAENELARKRGEQGNLVVGEASFVIGHFY
ncbi:hypothetical protein YB2330_001196 [Saitoella coloradoensis]